MKERRELLRAKANLFLFRKGEYTAYIEIAYLAITALLHMPILYLTNPRPSSESEVLSGIHM